MRKNFSDEHLYDILLIFIMVLFCCLILYGSLKPKVRVSAEYLRGNEAQLEQLIGDYSEFYCVIDKDKNNISRSIGGTETSGTINFVVPDSFDVSSLIVDFYTSWDEYLASYACDFTGLYKYKIKGKCLRCVRSELPFIFIDIDSGELDKVNSSHSYEVPEYYMAPAKFSYISKNQNYSNINMFLKPRGAGSWGYQHKPYTIKFNSKIPLAGLGNYKKWNLVANVNDLTCVKNKVFYDLARGLGLAYTPEIDIVNLYINDDYQGVYSLVTKVDSFCNDSLTIGDFLINWGAPNVRQKIYFDCQFEFEGDENGKAFYDLVWPEDADYFYINYVTNVTQEYLTLLEQEGDLSNIIDMESFAKYYWVEEITMNFDAWFRSNYTYYKKSTGKFYAGPIWDLDLTLGTSMTGRGDLDFSKPAGWKIRYYGYYVPLFKNKTFVTAVNKVYEEYNIPELMEKAYQEMIYLSNQLIDEGSIHYDLYGDEQNWSDFEYGRGTSYEYYVNKRLKFFRKRIDWIKKVML